MSSFSAKYPGTCADCDQRFSAGAEVTYNVADDIVHVTCPRPRPPGDICGGCFTELPVSGVCGVCA